MKSRLSYEISIFRRRRSENAMLWWHNKSIFHNKSISKRLLCEWDDGAQGEMSDNRTDNSSGHDSDYRGIRGSHHRQRYFKIIKGPNPNSFAEFLSNACGSYDYDDDNIDNGNNIIWFWFNDISE